MIAIDGGKSGGIAVLLSGQAATVFHMPATDGEIIQKLKIAKASQAETAYLEDIVFFTGNKIPGSRVGKYAANWGFLKGALMMAGYRIVLVRPQKWQGALGLGNSRGMTQTAWKNKLKQRAEELFPGIKITLATADALLVLEAARRGLLE